jgi:hypothetical protein
MADSKISGLTAGTVVDPANDWFVYVDTSDTTQDLITGTTKKLRPSNVPISTAMQTALNAKQNTLVSATNIKTINTQSILGSGDITIGGSAAWGGITGTLSTQTDLQSALNAKENSITAGTTSQYYRGDKTFQTLDKTAVGLGNVDNTSDANKPISTATQTALNAKENTITAGTTSQYYRGDKTFQALDKTAVGLGNVANATTTISTSAPSGGADGDIWFQYTP